MKLSIDGSAEPLPPNGGETTVEVSLNGTAKSLSTTRHIVLVVDTSISMGGEKIEHARKGAEKVLDRLDGDDYVSLVRFDSNAEVVLEMNQWDEVDRDDVYEAVRGSGNGRYDGELVISGGTNIPKALEAAKDQFEIINTNAAEAKDLILLSDGQDKRHMEVYEDLATDFADSGVTISAGGIGDYNRDVMLTLGRESGGESYNLDDPDQIDEFLETRVVEAGKVVASNPTVEIEVADRFWLNTDEDAYFTDPQAQSRPIEELPDGGQFDTPRITAGKPLKFSFVVRGSKKQTGPEYHLLNLAVEDCGQIVETNVDVQYEDDPPAKTQLEKRRQSAKVICDATESDEKDLDDAIGELEKIGYTEKARKLRGDDDESGGGGEEGDSDDPGKIEVTKALADADDEE